MMLAWMVYASVIAAAAGVAGCALDKAGRALGRSTRFVWIAVLSLSVLWPAWAIVTALLPAADQSSAVSPAILPTVVIAARRGLTAAFVGRLTAIGARTSWVFVAAWCVASVILLVRLLRGVRRLATQRRGWLRRIVDGVPVLVAPDIGPAVVGIRRPEVVIPEWALSLEAPLRALVLRHEQEHVRARDTLPRLLSVFAPALFPWNAALWWQASRLALALEVDCDARVLNVDARRDRYGLLLLAIAHRQSLTLLAPALSEPSSHLERRIRVMQRSPSRRPTLVAVSSAMVAIVALGVACSTPTPEGPASPGANGAVESARQPARGPKVQPTAMGMDQPYFDFQVEKQAAFVAGSVAPRYPDALRKRHVEGEVLAQFVVDNNGLPEASTFKVLRSSDELFVSAVRSVLGGLRFTPAEVGGRAVKQVVQMPFVFSLSR
jgi:TonB family protein